MKNATIILLLLFGTNSFAQRIVEKEETVNKNQTVSLDFQFANEIKVEQWDKKQISVKASVEIDNGEGNEYFELKTDRNSKEIKVLIRPPINQTKLQ